MKTDQIETINRQQIVTGTDRLLLSGLPKRRMARGSAPCIQMSARKYPTSREQTMTSRAQTTTSREQTMIVRAMKAPPTTSSALAPTRSMKAPAAARATLLPYFASFVSFCLILGMVAGYRLAGLIVG